MPDIDAVNENGMTQLHVAACVGDVNAIKKLLQDGADPQKPNRQSQLPIHIALIMPIMESQALKANKREIFKLLKDRSPQSLNSVDSSGNTILHRIIIGEFPELISETLDLYPELLAKKNKHSLYPIHTAILNQRIDCMARLMAYSGVIFQMDAQQRTSIEYAFRSNNQKLVDVFIDQLTVLECRCFLGKTPLLLAAECGNLFALLKLIDKGADLRAKDHEGNSVLHHAVLSGNIDMVRKLIDIPELDRCATNNNKQIPFDLCYETNKELSELLKDSSLQYGQ